MDVVHAWSNIALIWIVFLTFIAVLPVGVLLFFAIKGMHRLRQVTRKYLRSAQSSARQVSHTTERLSHQVAAPVIYLRAKVAQVDRLRRATLRRKQA